MNTIDDFTKNLDRLCMVMAGGDSWWDLGSQAPMRRQQTGRAMSELTKGRLCFPLVPSVSESVSCQGFQVFMMEGCVVFPSMNGGVKLGADLPYVMICAVLRDLPNLICLCGG